MTTTEFFAALTCTPGITWTKDIAKLFAPLDVAHMKAARNIDISSYESIKIWAVAIYGHAVQ